MYSETDRMTILARLIFGGLLLIALLYTFVSGMITIEQLRDFLIAILTARGVALGVASGIQTLRKNGNGNQ